LPYYITSPIFRKIVENQIFFPYGLFMIQKEVAEKIKTDATKKSYLWWIVNYFYEVNYLKTVPPKAFNPPPKVYSSIVELKKKDDNLIPKFEFKRMLEFLDIVSPFKRKTLNKIFKMKGLDTNKIDVGLLKKRTEELSFKDLDMILSKIFKQNITNN
jgi:16S rRNA (adenine1518-N6/adenine1519-N6)-dimethyltransferase